LIGAERRRAADGLKQAHLCLDAALNNMSQGLCMYDEEQRLRVYNRRYCEIFGFRPEQLHLGMTFRDNIELGVATGHQRGQSVEDIYQERVALIARGVSNSTVLELSNDLVIAVWQECMPSGGWVVTYEDITERRRNEARLVHMARHDALTGLPNRVLLRERAGQELAALGRGERLAVMCLDLDQFKTVNDTLGHPIGDALLQAVSARLQASVREGDMVARMSGDEFAVLQIGLDGPEQAGALAARIVELLAQPFDLDGHQVMVGTSIGIALAPDDADNPDTLMRSADMALYRAKTDGRGTYRFFELEMDARLQARRTLELDLRRAVANKEFELYYQPLVDLGSDRISGVEALVRWHHPERGMVSPAEFIPLAEEIGLIVPLGEWVLREACATAVGWSTGSPDGVKVAVNLSAAQFRSRNLVQAVTDALADSGLPANLLELEITESLMLEDSQTVMDILHQLRGMGVRISMDDFGTGYSSLSYLRSFPFDKIKIDQSFVRDLLEHEDSGAIVRAVVGLGNSLGMSTTAEGVETEEQLTRLREEGCKEVQGYLFSPPKPASEIAVMLARSTSLKRDEVTFDSIAL
jgi:diguanylate cyclase (GGDEF)-like protein